jgi:hypothetical protein
MHTIYVQDVNITFMYQMLTSLKPKGGIHITGINLFSNLPATIKTLNHHTHVFKPALRDYLLTQSIYYVDGFTSIEKF